MILNNEIQRYARQLSLQNWGIAAQDKLKNATAFVAGAGGLGSPALMYLAAAGVGTLVLCDFDSVELTNLNRQVLHSERKIGMPKVDSAVETLRDLNPHIRFHAVATKITSANAETLAGDADVIIDCLDNFDTRHVLNTLSVAKSIPMVHAGVSGFQGQITFLHPPETACLACFYPQKPKKQSVPILGATAGILGALQSMEAIKHITGMGDTLKNRLLFFDGFGMNFSTITIAPNPKCRVCGKIRKK